MKYEEGKIMNDIQKALEGITPDIYESLKTSVAKGRWPNGQLLTQRQKEDSMQLIIAYEAKYVSESERVGSMPPSGCKS